MADVIPKDVEREGVRTLARRGAQVVDVSPREEYDEAHLVGATNIPLAMISRHTANRLMWDKPVVVYSRNYTCDLSARAAWRLASMGFTQIFRYAGGIEDWLANGLPVEGSKALAKGAGDLADLDVPTCTRMEKMREVRERVTAEGWNSCVVTNDQLVVLGLLRSVDLEKGDPTWPAEEVMERAPQTFRLNAPLEQVFEYFRRNPGESALVTTSDGKLFGIILRDAAEKAAHESI